MVWPLDDQLFGPRNWGRRPATDGVIFHTTEYGGPGRDYAIQCANDQARRTASGDWAQPGSYNFIIYDSATRDDGVLLTVAQRDASGGINPSSPYWHPEPWLQDILPVRAFSDPTMYHLQISFSGKAAALSAGKYPRNMIDTAARLLLWAEAREWAADDLVVSGHVHWQDNRSDPGAGVIDRILERYDVLKAQADSDVSTEEQLRDCRRKVIRLRARLAAAEAIIEEVRATVTDPGT